MFKPFEEDKGTRGDGDAGKPPRINPGDSSKEEFLFSPRINPGASDQVQRS